jgi:hypothetical protein
MGRKDDASFVCGIFGTSHCTTHFARLLYPIDGYKDHGTKLFKG